MRAVLSIQPTTNYQLASAAERADTMRSFGRVLMGLSHPVSFYGQARQVAVTYDWPKPPTIERQWYAVVTADDETALEWRTRTLRGALEGVGLRCDVDHSVSVLGSGWGDIGRHSSRNCVLADNGACVSSLVLRRWPREVGPGWLGQALATDLPVDVAIHVQPEEPQEYARFLKRQVAIHSQDTDAGAQLGHDDAEEMRIRMVANQDRPCKIAIVFTVRAGDRPSLKKAVDSLKYQLGLNLATAAVATFEQDRGLEATSLVGKCSLEGAFKTADCTHAASTWPFQPATVNHPNGAPIGTSNGMLVKLDPFDLSLESFGGIVLAKVGMGKSYFLKLLSRRLEGVEVIIVEQRSPSEYDTIRAARILNLSDVGPSHRAGALRDFVSSLWAEAKADPRPRLLVLDELWSLLRDSELASLIEEIARIGRHHYLALWIATQQCRELLDTGKAVLDNAAVRVMLRQHDRDLNDLCDAVGLPAPARRYLRGAARGQALIDVGGMLVPVDIQASPDEHKVLTTDPRERAAA